MKFEEEYFTSQYKKYFRINFFKKCEYQSYVKYLFKLRQGTLLDCGCGLGNFLRFAEKKFETMGFDVSKYAISKAKIILNKSKIWVGSVEEKIPLKDKSVDIVTAFDVVEHLYEHDIFFNEVYRILNNQGIFLIRIPNMDSWTLKKKGREWYGYQDKTHISMKQKDYWLNVLNDTGFNVIETGTDLIWDTPIFSKIPNILQRIFFKGSKLIMQLYKPFFHVNWGDNLIIICRKE